MVNRNIQMKKKKDGTWENLYPLTFNENVFNNEGIGLTQQLNDMNQNINNSIIDKTTDVKTELNNKIDSNKIELNNKIDSNKIELNNKIDSNKIELENSKTNRMKGIIYAVDYEKQNNETDDEFINRLLNMLPINEGTLVLEGREYILQNTIELDHYQKLKGAGHSTILNGKAINTNIIKLKKVVNEEFNYGVSMEDFQVIGNHANTGIHLNHATHLTIRNVYVYDTNWGIWGTSVWLASYDRVTVRNYGTMGKQGFYIEAGTSNVLTNVWVKNFEEGFNLRTLYSTLNSCAVDTFIKYAYYIRQSAVLNGCGAEDADLRKNAFVFGAGARGVTFNSCETMNIDSGAVSGESSIFYLNGTSATVNNYRNTGSFIQPKINLFTLENNVRLTDNGSLIQEFNERYFFKDNARGSRVLSFTHGGLSMVRWNKEIEIGVN